MKSLSIREITIREIMAVVAASSLICWAIGYQIQSRQRMRDAAKRSGCINNLRQLGIALASYAGPHGSYPPGTIPNPALPEAKRLGWGVKVYLLLEEGCSGCPSADSLRAWDDPALQVDAGSRSGMMFCPSLPRSTTAKLAVPASYIGIAGLGPDAPLLPRGDRRAGIFGDHRSARPADVTDGMAYTMMVAESSVPSGPWFAGGRSTVRGLDPSRKPYLGPGCQFGGIHGEGAYVLMADGSVRWVRPTASGLGFEAMSTMAGGEVVADPDDSP